MVVASGGFPLIGIVGATGLVGLELRSQLRARGHAGTVHLFASSARLEEGILDLAKSESVLARCEVVLNAASNETALHVASRLSRNQVMIDNSSAFRLNSKVPLVVPEVNPEAISLLSEPRVFANPNCTTILLCVALQAFRDLGIERVIVSTYQAASGAGIRGMEELETHLKARALGEALPKAEVFPFTLAGNVLSHNTAIRSEADAGAGYNEEEWKVVEETRKILNLPSLEVSATCMRVPVLRAHTEAVTVDCAKDFSLDELRARLAKASGLRVVDSWKENHFPMPLEAEHQDLVLVGRLRKDASRAKTFHLLLAGDQIRKGAATNALQIMDLWNSRQGA